MALTKEEIGRSEREPVPGKFQISDLKIDERARRPRVRWMRWFAALVGISLLVLGAIRMLRERLPVVETVVARAATNEPVTLLNASGYVTPRRRATVAAKITGRLEQVLVEEGMRVSEGQELATLDNTDASVRLASAEAETKAAGAALQDLEVNLANARREQARSEELHRAGITTAQSLDAARTTVESLQARIALTNEQVRAAEARVQVTKQDLDNTIIRAPFAGLVVSKDAQRGEIVSPVSAGGGFTRTGIATIVDMNSLEIEVDVNESYIARVKPGQPVTATLDAYPEWKIPCRVRTIIPTADRQKATVKVRVSFDRLDPRILPDMGLKVSFLGDQPAKPANASAVLVPGEAVRDEGTSKTVFLYRDGVVERRAVRVGEARGSDREILAGVASGDQVLLRAPQDLRDGQHVKLKQ